MTTLLSINLMLSFSFMMLNHPMSMTLTLLLMSIATAMITGTLNQSFWFSYIMFMIMVGGMLVMIIYMTSIASNEKFKKNPLIWTTMLMIPIAMETSKFLEKKTFHTLKMDNESKEMYLTKFFNFPLLNTTIMIMLFLLMTMIIIVKITSTKNGPLRQKY